MDFLKITDETEEEFEEIAQTLFDKYAVQTHSGLYRLIELEFYWNSPKHVDNSTYKRNYVNPKSGQWFFHYSGVDIALKNDETGGYGGILIRGIYNVTNEKIFKGPMVCVMKLFSETNAFTSHIKTQVIPYTFEKSEIRKGERVGLGVNAKENGAEKFNYAFTIDPKK
jgi:hypothetical protein